MESRSAAKSLISNNDTYTDNEYFYRKKALVEQQIRITGDPLTDRRRYNSASMTMKVRLKRICKRLGIGIFTTYRNAGCLVEPKVLQEKIWWGDDDDVKFPSIDETFVDGGLNEILKGIE